MERRWLLALALGAAGGLAACAQILGIDDRTVSAPDDAGADGSIADTGGGGGGDAGPDADSGGLDADAGDASDAADAADGEGDADAGPLTDCGADATSVDLETSPENCGACGHACTVDGGAPHLVAACANALCTSACEPLWGDCADAGAGCVFSVASDLANCGACGQVCGAGNAAPTCSGGKCTLNCKPGFFDCDGNQANGCEKGVLGDPANCGACGFQCPAGVACDSGGACVLTKKTEDVSTGTWITMSLLVADTDSLYWVSRGAPVNTPNKQVRTIKKDGTGLQTLYGDGKDATTPGYGVFVDKSWIYYQTGSLAPLRGPKGSAQPAMTFMMGADAPADVTGLLLDTDATVDATRLFFTTNGNQSSTGGLYRYVFGAASKEYLDNSGAAYALARSATDVYWAVGNTVKHAQMAAANPSPAPLGTVPAGNVQGIAVAGADVYATSTDCNVYKIGDAVPVWTAPASCNTIMIAYDATTKKLVVQNKFDVWTVTTTGPKVATLVWDHGLHSPEVLRGFQAAGGVVYVLADASVYEVHE